MSNKSQNCGVKTFTKILGEVAAIITSTTPPDRKNVLWAKPVVGQDKYYFYAWDGTAWITFGSGGAAGNYDTLLDDTIAMIEDVGGYPQGTLVSELKGDPFISMWDKLLFPNSPAVYEDPDALLAGNPDFLLQVGDTKNITLTATFNQGDAGAVTAYELHKSGSVISTSQSYLDSGVVLNSPGSIPYIGKFTYADGPILNDVYGNPDPSGRIMAGSINTLNTVTYKWILPIFFGSDADGLSIDPTTGTKLLVEITGTTLTITFPSDGPAYYYLAVPDSTPEYIKYFITEISKGPMGAGNAWEPSTAIQITDGNFSSQDYKLYRTGFVTQFNLPVQFKQT